MRSKRYDRFSTYFLGLPQSNRLYMSMHDPQKKQEHENIQKVINSIHYLEYKKFGFYLGENQELVQGPNGIYP